jgi:hypothetical protein
MDTDKLNNCLKTTGIISNVFRPKKTLKKSTVKLYNTVALPTLLHGSENWTIKAKDARRITAAEMKHMRITATDMKHMRITATEMKYMRITATEMKYMRITAAEMKHMRITAGYTWTDIKQIQRLQRN